MGKLLSLWHAVPRGGQLSRNVWTRLLLLVCMLSATQGAWAETATFTVDDNLKTGTTTDKVGVITLSLPTNNSNGFSKSNNGLYAGGGGGTFTLTADEGYVITSIVMTKNSNSKRFNNSSNAPSGTTITENGSGSDQFLATWAFSTGLQEVTVKNNGGGVTLTQIEVTYEASSGGGGTSTDIAQVSNKVWNFSTGDTWSTGDIATTFHNDNLELVGTSSNKMAVASGTVTINNKSFTKCIETKGTGTSDYRYIRMKVAANRRITVYAYATGGSRKLKLAAGSFNGSTSKEFTITSGNTSDVYTWDYEGEATDIYIYNSGTNSLKIYQIEVGDIPSTTTYAITMAATSNGSFTVKSGSTEVTEATAGKQITVETTPAAGYQTEGVTLSTGGTVTQSATNKYTFSMPAEAVEVTATFAALPPSIAFNNPTTTMTVGGADVTNTATLTNATGSTITYTSSNTTVATVDGSGKVHAVAAGTTKITATYTQGGTDYTAYYNMTVNAVSEGSTMWDFTTLSSDEIAAMRYNVTTSPKNLKENNDDKYFSNTGSFDKFVGGDGTELNVTEGLTFGKSGGSLSAADIRYYYGDGDKRIYIKSSNEYVQLPEQDAGTQITISWRADGGSRTLTPVNATLKAGSSATISTSGQTGTSTFVVDAKGTVQFKVNGNVSLFLITKGNVVNVTAPTITPATGEDDATHTAQADKSITITTTNADGGNTYYKIGETAETNVANITTEVTNSGTPFTIDLTAYQDKNVVISAVTKYNDGTGDFYSPITTATYTYAGVITPMMQLSNMSLQAGNWDIIIPVITDHQGIR